MNGQGVPVYSKDLDHMLTRISVQLFCFFISTIILCSTTLPLSVTHAQEKLHQPVDPLADSSAGGTAGTQESIGLQSDLTHIPQCPPPPEPTEEEIDASMPLELRLAILASEREIEEIQSAQYGNSVPQVCPIHASLAVQDIVTALNDSEEEDGGSTPLAYRMMHGPSELRGGTSSNGGSARTGGSGGNTYDGAGGSSPNEGQGGGGETSGGEPNPLPVTEDKTVPPLPNQLGEYGYCKPEDPVWGCYCIFSDGGNYNPGGEGRFRQACNIFTMRDRWNPFNCQEIRIFHVRTENLQSDYREFLDWLQNTKYPCRTGLWYSHSNEDWAIVADRSRLLLTCAPMPHIIGHYHIDTACSTGRQAERICAAITRIQEELQEANSNQVVIWQYPRDNQSTAGTLDNILDPQNYCIANPDGLCANEWRWRRAVITRDHVWIYVHVTEGEGTGVWEWQLLTAEEFQAYCAGRAR